jgi:hypothetical protein
VTAVVGIPIFFKIWEYQWEDLNNREQFGKQGPFDPKNVEMVSTCPKKIPIFFDPT